MYAARTAKLEYEQKAGLLVRKDEVEAVWSKFASVMRTAMRAIPRRMAPLLEGQEIGMIELRLQEAIDAELTALSKNPLGEPMQE
jgi:phage terminase Nu1 subunit (DNA packaging protein)